MASKSSYRSTPVQKIDAAQLAVRLAAGAIVAIDVAKDRMVAAIATLAFEVVALVRWRQLTEGHEFLEWFDTLRASLPEVRVLMEPTGSYGDALRAQLHARSVPVLMMDPKRTHDARMVFDGVPSMHDPKAAMTLLNLHQMGQGRRYEPASKHRRTLRSLVDLYAALDERAHADRGRLEALMARHFPESMIWLTPWDHVSWLHVLQQYPDPKQMVAHRDEVAKLLRRKSACRLSVELIEGVLSAAARTTGEEMDESAREATKVYAREALRAHEQQLAIEHQLGLEIASVDESKHLRVCVGVVTTAVLIAYLGELTQYASTSALLKAAGMNLKERSSGEHKGRLKITKRGPTKVRQYLFMAALRLIMRDPIIRAWYIRRGGYRVDNKIRAVVAVMRKLLKALWHVARGKEFRSELLVDVRALRLNDDAMKAATATNTRPTVRTTTRPPSKRARRRERAERLAVQAGVHQGGAAT